MIQEVSSLATSISEDLHRKIINKTARVGVLGLGYVGLPLAVGYKAGFDVIGIDVQQSKVDQFNAGRSYIKDVPDHTFAPLVRSGKLRATSDFSIIHMQLELSSSIRGAKDEPYSYLRSFLREADRIERVQLLSEHDSLDRRSPARQRLSNTSRPVGYLFPDSAPPPIAFLIAAANSISGVDLAPKVRT